MKTLNERRDQDAGDYDQQDRNDCIKPYLPRCQPFQLNTLLLPLSRNQFRGNLASPVHPLFANAILHGTNSVIKTALFNDPKSDSKTFHFCSSNAYEFVYFMNLIRVRNEQHSGVRILIGKPLYCGIVGLE